jgi:hypothetical protein
MQRYFLIIGFLIAFSFTAVAQVPIVTPLMPGNQSRADSIQASKDTAKSKAFAPKQSIAKVYHPDSTHSPSKAWHRSVILPGWGQVYNRKIWKVPVIYTGLTLLVLMYDFNNKAYAENLAIARYRAKGTQPSPGDKYYALYQLYSAGNYGDAAINDAVRGYARYRDLSVLLFVASWGIQTIDAYIDAKFMHSYSMDNNFSVKVAPTMMNNPVYAQNFDGAFIPGLKLTFTLR